MNVIFGYNLRMISAPAAALELGFVINRIKHAVVCGHSDCKAINFLYTMRNNIDDNGKIVGLDNDTEYSPFSIWLRKHGVTTLQRYNELGKTSFTQPLILNAGLGLEQFPAYIDKDCVLSSTDKLSQVILLLKSAVVIWESLILQGTDSVCKFVE